MYFLLHMGIYFAMLICLPDPKVYNYLNLYVYLSEFVSISICMYVDICNVFESPRHVM